MWGIWGFENFAVFRIRISVFIKILVLIFADMRTAECVDNKG